MSNFTHKVLQVHEQDGNNIVYNSEYYRSNKVECDEYADEMNYRDDVLALVVPIDFKLSEDGCSLEQARAELAAFEAGAYQPQKQQQQQLQAVVPAAAKGAWYVAKKVSGSVFNHNAVYAIVHTAANEDACWEWRQHNDPYSSGNFRNVNDAIMAHGKKCANDTYLKPVYDKKAIMKRAWELRKQGLTASNAMKQAWAEAKNGSKF